MAWRQRQRGGTLYVPMDCRVFAGPGSKTDYAYYNEGGWSWSIPFIAGLYVLACQVKPTITPEAFLRLVVDTGDPLEVEADGRKFRLENVANPARMVSTLRKGQS